MAASSEPGARRPVYYEYDRIAIPSAIPELGVKQGEQGIVEDLKYHNNTVFACVRVYRSTRETEGMVEMEVRPEEKVLSYSPVA